MATEAAAVSKIVLTCDQCGKAQAFSSPWKTITAPSASVAQARAMTAAKARGWRIERETELPDLCPTCKQWSAYP